MSPELIERLKALRDYHTDAACRLHAYGDDAEMRKSDSEHYRKRATIHRDYILTLDEVINDGV